ncbi:Predicted arabinose efflux permease, MFS family [Amycolatopsis pretoriensis]|uniref:Predicted arabinose efflux permease, MFS family n=1 Tax=Amycolatopsis pretoriensis TaxID=218821 RepID=A0A1H5QIG9_9PSEU|nr:MFS transporter [Amycolatopsis pretoriensis]SEF25168.1 Predicted arabinose efflux permease, MFS family [Amycolatopsis pretoriensis]
MLVESRTRLALGALSAACFVSVTSENLPVALLPQLASGLGVADSSIGLLMTGYALVVAVSVVPLVALTSRWDRRTTALVTLGMVVVSNVVLALAPNYGVAIAARLVAAAGHGVFWSVVASMAARLLGPGRGGRATAVVFAGNSLAFLFGLSVSSWLGTTFGWRFAVLVVAAVAAVTALVIRVTVAPMPALAPASGSRIAVDRAQFPVNVTTLLVVTGHFAAFTYITAIIARYVHLTGPSTSLLLFAHGLAGLLGLVLIGRHIDHHPRATALVTTAGLAVCMLGLLVSPGPVVSGTAIVAWAGPAAGIGVVLQAAVLRVAKDRPDLASAVYIVAFQIGIALGAALGGLGLDHGMLPAAVLIAATGGLTSALVVWRSRAFAS